MNPLITAYIGVGSNMDHPEMECRRAGERIAAWPQTHAFRSAALYRSEAHVRAGGPSQAPYINTVFEIKTDLSCELLLDRLRLLEIVLGRNEAEKGQWLARPIDLDILAYGDEVIKHEQLVVPHPRLAERRFVLAPWAELNAHWVHPVLGRSIQDLLDAVWDDKALERIWPF